jgi:hypothetical protein
MNTYGRALNDPTSGGKMSFGIAPEFGHLTPLAEIAAS